MFYQLALSLVPRLKHGDEHMLHDLIATCLFNMSFWSDYLLSSNDDDKDKVENMLIKHFAELKLSAANKSQQWSGDKEALANDVDSIKSFERVHVFECLSQIKMAYLSDDCLMRRKAVENTRLLSEASSNRSSLFASPRYSAHPLVSSDWMYLPIIRAVEANEIQMKTTNNQVCHSLLYIFIIMLVVHII